ncbi:hypothetical protein B0H19DRAFT_1373065 [Mycena capillaripes]|nr:hypothetical protein B0H19DRAFT_1373065 [Mycena capillaripes]
MDSVISLDVNTTIGALQIGVLVSYVLLGVITTQTYIYYSRFPEDSGKLRALVGFVWVCELAHALCIGHTHYVYTISNYTHPERLSGAVPKSLGVAVLLSGVIAGCVQGFFSFRILTFSKTWYIPIFCWAMAILQLVGNTGMFIKMLDMVSVESAELRWGWLAVASLSVTVANDLTITATLVILLLRQRPNAYRRTGALVDKLIVWTIETGMLTSAASIAMLACFFTMKDNFVWMGVFTVAPRLFSNSLLASLNSRATLRTMNEISIPFSIPVIGSASISIQMTETTDLVCDFDAARVQCDKGASEDI